MPQKQISAQTWIGIACGAGCLVVLIVGGGLLYLGGKFVIGFMPRDTTYERAQHEVYFLVMKPTYLPPRTGEPHMDLTNQGSWVQVLMQVYGRGRHALIINQMRGDLMRTTFSKEMDTVNGRQVYLQRQDGRETAIVRYDTTLVMVSGDQLDELKKVAASMEPVFHDQLERVRQAQKSHPASDYAQPFMEGFRHGQTWAKSHPLTGNAQPPAMPAFPGGR